MWSEKNTPEETCQMAEGSSMRSAAEQGLWGPAGALGCTPWEVGPPRPAAGGQPKDDTAVGAKAGITRPWGLHLSGGCANLLQQGHGCPHTIGHQGMSSHREASTWLPSPTPFSFPPASVMTGRAVAVGDSQVRSYMTGMWCPPHWAPCGHKDYHQGTHHVCSLLLASQLLQGL